MIESKCKEFIGYATQTLMGDSNFDLEVLIPDFLPLASGTIKETSIDVPVDITIANSALGGKPKATINTKKTVLCTYLGSGCNTTPPNIHIGEQVKVLCIGDGSDFYWYDIGRDNNTRTTERLRLHVANKKNQKDALNDSTSYSVDMDSRKGKKKIRIHTSKGTGEAVSYNILIDMEKSTFSINDSEGNGMSLDSLTAVWEIHNNKGSSAVMDKTNITVTAPSTVTVLAKDVVVTATSTITETSPNIKMVGNVTVLGNISATGTTTMVGNLTVNGNSQVNGTASATAVGGAHVHNGS